MSVQYNTAGDVKGEAWNSKYSVPDATAALLRCVEVVGADGNEKVRADYNSATAFSSTAKAACINFPLGSEVFDLQAKIKWHKTAAAGTDTWCYSGTYT
jgi:hypothetical protein